MAAMLVAALGAAADAQSVPVTQRLAAAERVVAANPASYDGHNELAMALARRARDTADAELYDRADAAIARSLELAPDNFEALKLRAWVMLGKHEFGPALDLARTLNKRVPDDLLVYGLLTAGVFGWLWP